MSKKTFTIIAFGETYECWLSTSRYQEGNGIAVQVWYDKGPFATLSKNFPEDVYILAQDEFFVKNVDENEELVQQMTEQGIIELVQPAKIGGDMFPAYRLKGEWAL